MILILVFVVGLLLYGRYDVSTNTLSFLPTKLDQLMSDDRLMDSIGGSSYFEYKFNDIEFKRNDTLQSSIKIIGKEKVLIYNAVHVRKARDKNEWDLKDENLSIE